MKCISYVVIPSVLVTNVLLFILKIGMCYSFLIMQMIVRFELYTATNLSNAQCWNGVCFVYAKLVRSSVTLLWFPHISGQTAQAIDLQLDEYICYGTLQAWLIFGRAPMKFNRHLTSDCSTSFRAFSDKPFKGLIFNLANAFVMVLSRLH